MLQKDLFHKLQNSITMYIHSIELRNKMIALLVISKAEGYRCAFALQIFVWGAILRT